GLAGQAGIAAQMGGAAAAAANSAGNSVLAGGGNSPASLPVGPAGAGSTGLSVSGSYRKHYTAFGSNSEASFYLDVNTVSTFGPSGETGSTTYTAWLEVGGVQVVSYTDKVEPFSSSTVFAGGTNLGGLPPLGATFGFETGDFGFDLWTWDWSHSMETDSYNAT